MENDLEQSPALGEAATRYLSRLSAEEKDSNQSEVHKFARWCGWEIPFTKLSGPAVAGYAEQLSTSDTDYARKLVLLRAFLAYAKKTGWSQTNLGIHLKAKKNKAASSAAPARNMPEAVTLTKQKYDELTEELALLKEKSLKLMHDIQVAAADKDFRENAPLQAAREERGHVEGQIKELEQTLKAATIIEEKKTQTKKSGIGDTIYLCDLSSGEECCFRLVDPREVNPAKGKISANSPLGKALIGKQDGQEIEFSAPVGRMRYRIIRIEH